MNKFIPVFDIKTLMKGEFATVLISRIFFIIHLTCFTGGIAVSLILTYTSWWKRAHTSMFFVENLFVLGIIYTMTLISGLVLTSKQNFFTMIPIGVMVGIVMAVSMNVLGEFFPMYVPFTSGFWISTLIVICTLALLPRGGWKRAYM